MRSVLLVLLAACQVAPDGSGDTDVVGVPGDSDTDVSGVDTDAEVAPDTDVTVVDTELALDPWTDGLVEVSGPLSDSDALQPSLDAADGTPDVGLQAMPVAVGDLDEDGAPEILAGAGVFPANHAMDQRAYHWTPTGLVPAPDVVLPTLVEPASGLLDLDGDGHLDLLAPSGRAAIAWGRGDGTFEPAVPMPGATAHALMVPWDVNEDGWLDLLVGGDCTVGLGYALRTGPRTYEAVWDHTNERSPAVGDPALLPVPGPTGTLVMVSGEACDFADPHPGFYEVARADDGHPRLNATAVPPASPSWVTFPIYASAVSLTQLDPMGASVIDLDHDGRQDLAMSQGLPLEMAWLRQPDGSWRDATFDLGLDVGATAGTISASWGLADPDLDRDGLGDLVIAVGDENVGSSLTTGTGNLHMLVFRAGSTGFEDVSAVSGIGRYGSWHGVVPYDLDGDADADLVLGGYGSPAALYRNDLPGGGALAVHLVGTTSNHLGYGAEVTVEAPGLAPRTMAMVAPGEDAVVPPPVLFAGLGSAAQGTVTVRWPSGVVQTVTGLAPGHHTLVEPELLHVEPASRHLPADGTSTATIRIVPRTDTGAYDPTATVTVLVLGASQRGAVVQDATGWTATVRAPRAGGVARVDVRINGAVAGVRPVIWFDAPAP